MNPRWQQMRSGDWALRIPGKRWAVAFVWRTWGRGYAGQAASGPTEQYRWMLGDAMIAAEAQWKARR
jgi:hypothetical protein